MQIIVDEIDPQYCPFYVSESWPNTLHIAYEEGSCRLDASPVADGLQQWSCHAKKGDEECPFCVTYDELKRRMEEIKGGKNK
jgi:hypothetical protein